MMKTEPPGRFWQNGVTTQSHGGALVNTSHNLAQPRRRGTGRGRDELGHKPLRLIGGAHL